MTSYITEPVLQIAYSARLQLAYSTSLHRAVHNAVLNSLDDNLVALWLTGNGVHDCELSDGCD